MTITSSRSGLKKRNSLPLSRFAKIHRFDLNNFIRTSLQEDVRDGDHTSLACIGRREQATARLLVKEKGILAGVELAQMIFSRVDKRIKMKVHLKDGARVLKGDTAFTVTGSAISMLTAERTVLNCLQRLSGIATAARKLSDLCRGTKARVLDTRKTTPGMRVLEKWAVAAGGGMNHRFGLYDMILIKDNHADVAGSIEAAVARARAYLKRKNKKLPIEVEARTLREVREVMRAGGVDRILLDNFSPAELRKAVRLVSGRFETEASGGIGEKNIRSFALTGVDYISVGALTHSVKSLDLSLKISS